jgi:hypothetical protein
MRWCCASWGHARVRLTVLARERCLVRARLHVARDLERTCRSESQGPWQREMA